MLFFFPLHCNFLQEGSSEVHRWAVNYKEACFQRAKLKDFIIRSFQQKTGKSLIVTLLTLSELMGLFFIHTNTPPCYIKPAVI